MKKVFLLAVVAMLSAAYVNAADKKLDVKGAYNEVKDQIKGGSPRAIGGNLGGFIGFSYQHNLKNGNMIDCGANFDYSWGAGISVFGTYDWVNPFNTQIPWNNKGSWNWAMGCGLAGGINFGNRAADRGFGGHVGAAGFIGVAYDFWFPLELSIDWRPEIGVGMYGVREYDHNGNERTRTVATFYTPGLLGCTLGVRYLF